MENIITILIACAGVTVPTAFAVSGAAWMVASRLSKVETKLQTIEKQLTPNGHPFPECAEHDQEITELQRRVGALE